MPAFLAEMVARGPWWAILAFAIVAAVCYILGTLLGKIRHVLGAAVCYIPAALFIFYIWRVRGGAGWLVWALAGAAAAVYAIVFIALDKKSPVP
jgi:F0F1-type ATP synthase assembly protein I